MQDSYPLVNRVLNGDINRMLNIDLTGKRALVAGVADDAGFGFAIAKALAEAGASVSVGTWPPALNIFMNLLERGKMDASRKLSSGELLQFEKIYPLDASFDTLADAPEEYRSNKRYKETGDFRIEGMARRIECDFGGVARVARRQRNWHHREDGGVLRREIATHRAVTGGRGRKPSRFLVESACCWHYRHRHLRRQGLPLDGNGATGVGDSRLATPLNGICRASSSAL